MAARLIRTWFIGPLILCGLMVGAVGAMCMHKPPEAGSQNVQSSSGQVHAACQPGIPAASYKILVPDWDGSSYRLKTIVNQ